MRKAFAAICVALVSAVAMHTASAELRATPLPLDTRLVTFAFDSDNTYMVLTRPRDVTRLQFSDDEEITTIAVGDARSFDVAKTKNGKHIIIKAKFENASTSLIVLTDKRSYEISLRSTFEGGRWYQRVQWEYPEVIAVDLERSSTKERVTKEQSEAEHAALHERVKPTDVNYDYTIDGSADFRPSMVFDTGTHTYLRLPKGLQDYPALFAVIDGEIALVNYVPEGDYLKVARVMQEMVLKRGKQEVHVYRGGKAKSGLFDLWSGNGQ